MKPGTKLALLGGTAAVALIVTLNLTGFCYREGRYLSQRQFLVGAIAHEALRMDELSSADAAGSFLDSHPDCCAVSAFPRPGAAINNLLGNRIVVVRIVYRMVQSEIDKAPEEGEFYEAYVAVTPCGRPIDGIGSTMRRLAGDHGWRLARVSACSPDRIPDASAKKMPGSRPGI